MRCGVMTGFVFLAVSGYALAEEPWVALDGPQIEAALDERGLQYDGAKQIFYKSGRTLYDNGRPSWGYWRVQGDQYCSQWPPADGWACYGVDVQVDAEGGYAALRFVTETGSATLGTYTD